MIRSHTARLLLVALLTLFVFSGSKSASAAEARAQPGDPVIIRLTTGESIYGELVSQTPESVVVRVAGIETTIQSQHIERVTIQRTATDRYRSMRAIIDDTDTPRLLLLIDWLIRQQLLDEARLELDSVLDIEPTNPEARRTSKLLDQRITLRERSREAQPELVESTRSSERERTEPPGRFEPGEFPLLTDVQVNLMKVYELDLQQPPRILIERDTVARFLNDYAGAAGLPRTEVERKQFFRKQPTDILELMFRLRARELYTDVRVLDLPNSLALFRDNVAGGWLTRSCASTSCHGGTDAPPPHLYNKRPFAETSSLTNLLIIDRFRFDDGSPLIDYERPGDSALLQLALPAPISARPHPDVPGWRPAFRTRDARRYRQTVDWINAMIRPRPELPIEYEPLQQKTEIQSTEEGQGTDLPPSQPPTDQPR